MSDISKSLARALSAQLESDLYLEKKRPEAALMRLLCKLGIESAKLDNRDSMMGILEQIQRYAAQLKASK